MSDGPARSPPARRRPSPAANRDLDRDFLLPDARWRVEIGMDQIDGSGRRDQPAPYQVPPPGAPGYADFLSRLVSSWKHAWQGSSEPYRTIYPSDGFGNREEER